MLLSVGSQSMVETAWIYPRPFSGSQHRHDLHGDGSRVFEQTVDGTNLWSLDTPYLMRTGGGQAKVEVL